MNLLRWDTALWYLCGRSFINEYSNCHCVLLVFSGILYQLRSINDLMLLCRVKMHSWRPPIMVTFLLSRHWFKPMQTWTPTMWVFAPSPYLQPHRYVLSLIVVQVCVLQRRMNSVIRVLYCLKNASSWCVLVSIALLHDLDLCSLSTHSIIRHSLLKHCKPN